MPDTPDTTRAAVDEAVEGRGSGNRVATTFRLHRDLKARLEAASKIGPYEISMTSIVERGIELALAELTTLTPPADAGEEGR